MAATGSEQQRLKTQTELLAERRSLEHEINKLIKERGEVQQKYENIDARLIAQMQSNYDAIEGHARKRLQYEAKIAVFTAKLKNATAERAQRFKAMIQVQERHISNEAAFESMLKLEQETLDAQLKIQIQQKNQRVQALADHERQLDQFVAFLGKFGDVFNVQKKYNAGLKQMNISSGRMRLVWASMLTLLEMSFKQFLQYDDILAKFRISMGMLRVDVKRIANDIREVGTSLAHIGVTFEGAAAAATALANEFGGTMKISKDLVETTSILKAQLGVAEDISAGFMRNMGALSISTAQSQKSMVYLANALSSAAGIPLNLVMQDVAKLSGNALAMISKIPGHIVKSAVAARQMGTTLNKMADASANLLSFTESVQAEMEASVLVGTAINLQLARQLAYQGDVVGSTKAIVAESKRINFEKLDYFQMQSFAAASGRSADELLRMVQADRQLNEARNNASLGLQKEVAAYDRLMSMKESELKNEGVQRELTVRKIANQARMEVLQQHFNQLLLEMGEVLFPVFDKLISIAGALTQVARIAFTLAVPFKIIEESLIKIAQIGKFFGAVKSFTGPLGYVAHLFGKIATFVVTFGGYATKIGGSIIGWLGPLAKFVLPFAKLLGPIGWIITAFQLIGSIWKNFDLKAPFFGLDKVIKEVLLDPFIKAWQWIKGIFVGMSPSKLGLGIVKGIIGVQTMIFDALTYPWRHFLAWVAEKIPGMTDFAKKLRGGATGLMQDVGVLDKKVTVTPEARVSEKPETATAAAKATTEQNKQEQDSVTLGEILKSIRDLNSNLMAGKIGIYIDGQLMSATLARQTAFRGGYGTNQANMG